MTDEEKLPKKDTLPDKTNQDRASGEQLEETPQPSLAENEIPARKLGNVTAKEKEKLNLGFNILPDEQSKKALAKAEGEEIRTEGAEAEDGAESSPVSGQREGEAPPSQKVESPQSSTGKSGQEQSNKSPGAERPKPIEQPQQPQSSGGQQPRDRIQSQSDEGDKNKKKKDEEEEKKKKDEEEEAKKKKEEEEKPPAEDETAPAGEEKKPAETSEEGPEAEGAQPEGAESGEATDELGEALDGRAERETGAQAIQAGTKAGEKAAGTGTATAGAEARALARIKTVLKTARLFLGSWPVVLVIIGVILLFIFIVWIIGILIPRTHTDTGNPEDKAAIEEVVSLSTSNKITFTKTDDLDKIKKGEIGKTSVQMMAYLAKKHEKIEINYNNQNYNGSTKSSSGTVKTLPAGENEPFEFDIVSVDTIKCANSTTGAKLSPIPINLSSSFNWTSLLKKEYNKTIICAVGYYPGETKVSGSFASQLGPGEFSILDISSAGPKAAKEKMAEVTSEMLKIDSSGATSKNGSLLPLKITLDSGYAKDTGTNSGVVGVLKNQIIAAYPTATSKDEGVIAGNPLYGIHVNYL